ncbi:MAG: LLM class flavin-dependent oxidoreductase [Natrialbaceae archaeon]|nr:LLM class flavin-dependent oxidoreductase [Natrialbaceae archaeon]
MQIGLMVSALAGLAPTDLASYAESLEYDAVWVGELWQESSVVQLAEMATATDEITIGSAILNVFSRSPAVLAMTAASLDRASDGRFVLGTGVSTEGAVRTMHGMAFERPVRRAHETIEIVQALLAGGDPVSYDGEVQSVSEVPPVEAEVPIYHAGLGPANRRVVGRLCDGWIPHNLPFSGLDDSFSVVAEAAEERGRDPESITVAPYVPAAVSDDEAEARDVLRRHVAYYAGSGEGYRQAVATEYPAAAEAIGEAWARDDRETAAAAVTDEMVDDLGVAGDAETVRARFQTLVDETVIDHPIVVVPVPSSETMATQTITELAPSNW